MADDSTRLALSRRQLLGGVCVVGVVSAGAGLGTTALFSDEEGVEGNTITAGTTNLIVEAGVVTDDVGGDGTIELTDATSDGTTADGDAAIGLDVNDLKPGDSFTIRLTVEVENNPMYVSVEATDATDGEGATPEPEPSPGPDGGTDGLQGEGDLDDRLDATLGWDDDRSSLHDNTLEGNVTPESGFDGTTSATDLIEALRTGFAYRGRNGASGSPPGGHAGTGADLTRIGGDAGESNVDRERVTHFLRLVLPRNVGNEIQGDSLSWDLAFDAEQVRNNSAGTGAVIIVTRTGSNTVRARPP